MLNPFLALVLGKVKKTVLNLVIFLICNPSLSIYTTQNHENRVYVHVKS